MKNKKTTYFIIGICTFIISFSLVATLNGVKDTYAATGACYSCGGVPQYIWSSSGGTPSDTCTGGSWSKATSYTSQAMCEAQNEEAACYFCSGSYSWGKYSYLEDGGGCSRYTLATNQSDCEARNNQSITLKAFFYTNNNGSVLYNGKECTTEIGYCEVDAPIPSYSGHTFSGYKKEGTTTCVNASKFQISSNTNFYACWTNVGTFKKTDGTILGTKSCNIDENGECKVSASDLIETPAGYTFAGWSTTTACKMLNSSSITLTSDATYYACFTQNASTFTATFKKTDGTVLGTKSCTTSSGSCTVSASDLIKTPAGYTFAGWSATTACKMLTQSISLTNNATYYACFTVNNSNSGSSGSGSSSSGSNSGTTAKTVYAYYDFNGGTLASGNNYSQCTISGTATSCSVTPPTPTREGYTFSGYRKSGETSCKTGNLVLTQNTNYQACWDKNVTEEESSSDSTGTYKALYEPEGGTVENNKTYDECTVSEGETSCKITLPLSEKEGYEFNGWRKSGETTCQTGEVSLTQTTRFFACYSSDEIDVPIEDIPVGDIIDKINEEIENNSKTGDILIFICWVVGIGAIAFATYYYHYHKKEI